MKKRIARVLLIGIYAPIALYWIGRITDWLVTDSKTRHIPDETFARDYLQFFAMGIIGGGLLLLIVLVLVGGFMRLRDYIIDGV